MSAKFHMLVFGVGCGLLLADLVALIVGAVHSAHGDSILIDAIILIGVLAIPFLVYPSLIILRDFTRLKL